MPMLIENGVASEVGALCEAFERHDRQLGYVALQSKLLLEDAARLYEENAKLRELVRMQYECIAGNCEWCKHRKNRESLDVECELDDLTRELGIEVDR